jgi:hypothetical protein
MWIGVMWCTNGSVGQFLCMEGRYDIVICMSEYRQVWIGDSIY